MEKLSQSRIDTMNTIKQYTDYGDNFNLYSIDIKYDYNPDNLTPLIEGEPDTQSLMDLTFSEALPGIDVGYKAPDYANYGCSAFTLKGPDGKIRMGRNYDFKYDSSAILVRCSPKDGYRSVSFGALDNIKNMKNPLESKIARAASLVSPFICIDGLNEKGLSIAVLTLDSEPVCQRTGKSVLPTTVLVRLVLDRAATTEEAVALISRYDNYAICGRDYHFYITDASGDGRVVEFDCEAPGRPTCVTKMRSITNFYAKYIDLVKPHQKNGIYGHGRERYDAIEAVIEKNGGTGDKNVAWEALKASAQEPNPESITSNTQWSICYNNTDLVFEVAIRRHWEDVFRFSL